MINVLITKNYQWLKGQAPHSTLSYNLTNVKVRFISILINQKASTLSRLPQCSFFALLSMLSTPINLNNLSCLPPTININNINQQIQANLKTNQKKLRPLEFNVSALLPGLSQNKIQFAPKIYQTLKILPFIFFGIIVINVFAMFFLNQKKQFFALLSKVLLRSGALILITGLIYNSLDHYLMYIILGKVNALKPLISRFILTILNSIKTTYVNFGVVYLIIGFMIYFVQKHTIQKLYLATKSHLFNNKTLKHH